VKILFVSRAYHPALKYGGPVVSLRRMATMLATGGHGVTVMCSNMAAPGMAGESLPAGRFLDAGVSVRFLPTPLRWRWEGLSPRAIREIPAAVGAADVVHVAGTRHFLGYLAETAARRRGVPYLVMPEGSIPPRFRSNRFKEVVDALYTRRSLARAGGIIATSDVEREELQGWGIDPGRLIVLPPRADHVELSPRPVEELRAKWKVRPGERALLWLGRIHPEKGLPVLLEALEDDRLSGSTLLLGGEAEDRDLERRLRARAEARLPGRVRFLGWLGHDDKAELFKLSDLFVFPSRKENFGLAAAEAVASGLPIVVTEGCGIASVVGGSAAVVCRYDAVSIADAIARVLGDDALLAKLREGCHEAAKRLDWPPLVAYLEQVYRRAMGSTPDRPNVSVAHDTP
jgi:glycosyltransferase involved in cell wall biosynthesis